METGAQAIQRLRAKVRKTGRGMIALSYGEFLLWDGKQFLHDTGETWNPWAQAEPITFEYALHLMHESYWIYPIVESTRSLFELV